MKVLLLFCVVFFSGHNIQAGDEINNGGGLSEQRITHAFLKISNYINLCLNLKSCHISQRERTVLNLILINLKEEYKNPNPISFVSEKKLPGFFIINGELKIAKTSNQVGSTIYFNLDLLYSKSNESMITMTRAISLLIHELAHHNNPDDDHTFLDLLGNKVALLYSEHRLQSPLTSDNRNITVNIFNHEKADNSFPTILLRVQEQLVDVSKHFKDELKCPQIILPFGVQIRVGTPKKAKLHNLHWIRIKEKDSSWNFKLVGNLSQFCEDKSKFIHLVKKFKVSMSFKAKKNIINKKVFLKLNKKSISFKQIYDPWIKFFDIPII